MGLSLSCNCGLLLVLPWINRTTLFVKHVLVGNSVLYLKIEGHFSHVHLLILRFERHDPHIEM